MSFLIFHTSLQIMYLYSPYNLNYSLYKHFYNLYICHVFRKQKELCQVFLALYKA